jgi:CDP-diacylglycerol--serine O-phosphatidyltransferase
MIWIAAVFDFLDGFSARMLKVTSPIGKELDSLADMVTFGVLPSVIMFLLIEGRSEQFIFPYLAFSIALFSAVRLAKFNTDERQSEQFIGLPTPACAFFVSAIPFVLDKYFINLNNSVIAGSLVTISILLSFLLVAELPLFSLKFNNFKWENNRIRFIFVIISVIALFVWNIIALPAIIIFYILLSLINLKTSK